MSNETNDKLSDDSMGPCFQLKTGTRTPSVVMYSWAGAKFTDFLRALQVHLGYEQRIHIPSEPMWTKLPLAWLEQPFTLPP